MPYSHDNQLHPATIEYYLSMHSWQIKVIEKSIKKADNKKAKFIEHEKVTNWLNSWDNTKKQEPSKF